MLISGLNYWELIIIMILVSIIIINILIQFSSRFYFFIKYDYLNVLTIWTLFAPRPMAFDYRIFYRDFYMDGSQSNLQEIEFNGYSLVNFFSMESKYYSAVCRCILYIHRMKKRGIEDKIVIKSSYYRLIERIVSQYQPTERVKSRQLVVTKVGEFKDGSSFKNVIISKINY